VLGGGRVLAFGAIGLLNALDISNGAVLWSRDVASDTDFTVPIWGFASSPLVVGDLVVVAAAGRLAAYDAASGSLKWLGPNRGGSYSSPHRWMAGDVLQVLLLNDAGVTGVAPAPGAVLWEHAWPGAVVAQLLVRSEDGDLALVAAVADGFRELARIAAIGGKTWNHPVLAGDVLLVRNGEEMAAFRLPLAAR